MDIIIVTLIAISSAIAGILPSTGDIKDNRFNFPKNIKQRGWITFAFLSLIIILTLWQAVRTSKKEEENDRKQALKDSVNRAKYDSSLAAATDRSIETFVNALARNGLKADSTNKQLVRIVKIVRDSLKTTLVNSPDPIIKICKVEVTPRVQPGMHYYDILYSICAEEAGVYDLQLKLNIVGQDSIGRLTHLSVSKAIPSGFSMGKDAFYNHHYIFRTNDSSLPELKIIYLYLTGTYRKSFNGKPVFKQYMCHYNIEAKNFLITQEELIPPILKVLSQKAYIQATVAVP